jgi:hypothetical protein
MVATTRSSVGSASSPPMTTATAAVGSDRDMPLGLEDTEVGDDRWYIRYRSRDGPDAEGGGARITVVGRDQARLADAPERLGGAARG